MGRQRQFKIVPDEDELRAIARELRFYPVVNDVPRTLTSEQIAQFNRDGFIKGIRVFDELQIDEHRRYFDELLARTLEQGGDSYSISSAHLRHARVYDLLRYRAIVDCVRDLLGENVVGWGSHFFCKMPHDGKAVSWHQDASYWPLTPSKTVTVWLAIDDADPENACMQFVPGSHLEGHLEYRPSSPDEENVLNQTVDVARFGEPVDIALKAGEISIHSDLLLHGSPANESDRRRCGLTLRYCAADVTAHLGWNQKGVVVSGTARTDRWPGVARPAED